jgi:hypothetical protein
MQEHLDTAAGWLLEKGHINPIFLQSTSEVVN